MSNVTYLRPMGVEEAEAKPVLTEEETRAAFSKKRKEWDEQWGGKCPHESIPEPDPGYKDKSKPSLIARVVPYIIITAFLGACLLAGSLGEWIIDLTAGVR